MRDRTFLLVGAKYLFWVFFLVAYIPIFANGHARITFGVSQADADFTRAQCEPTGSCGDNHDAFEFAQMALMTGMGAVIRATALAVLIADTAILLIGTVFLLRRRRGFRAPARFVTVLWKVQLIVVVLSLVIYLVLLGIGALALHRIPENARLVPFQAAFSSPFLDVSTLYYVAGFAAVNALSLIHNRALARLLRDNNRAVPVGV